MSFCYCCISFLKGAYTPFLLYFFFETLIFNGRRVKAKVIFRKTIGMRNCFIKYSIAKFCFDSMIHQN